MNPARCTRVAFAVVVVLLIAGCTKGSKIEWESPVEKTHPLVGRIWDVKAGSFIPEDTLVARLVASKFILLGERHDNPDHHALQAKLMRALVATTRRPSRAISRAAPRTRPASGMP